MRKIITYMVMLWLCVSNVYAAPIKYTSPTSTLMASGTTKVTAKAMTTSNGTLATGANATLEGVNYTLNNATLAQSSGTNVTGSGNLNATANSIAHAPGKPLTSNPGCKVTQTLTTAGKNASLEGVASTFKNPKTVILADSSTVFSVALTSPLATSIAFNGGTILLVQDLKMSGSATFYGDGVVDFNLCSLIFDGNPRTIGSNIIFQQASDFIFADRLTVTGSITFNGDSVMIGNGNVLDISQGGTIRIGSNTTLDFVNATLKGLGLGQIIFQDATSRLRLSDVTLEMNRNYTVTIGGMYVEGPTTIVTSNNILTFDQQGSLTVDGLSLIYDTLKFNDMSNIRPAITNNGPYVISVNDGVIRNLGSGGSGGGQIFVSPLTMDTTLTGFLVVSPNNSIYVNNTLTLNGNTFMAFFTNASQPLIFVAPNQSATLTNIFLEYFSPSFISLGAGASLIFGDKTKIDLGNDADLAATWTFKGNCVLNGQNHCLNFTSLANIFLNQSGSSLLIENIILKGMQGTSIRCIDNTCTVSLKNVQWLQDDTFSFTNGHFEFLSSVDMQGTSTFVYATNQQSTITSGATLTLQGGFVFGYSPVGTDNRDLIALEDETATIFMNGATLVSTITGMQLTKGSLLVDDDNALIGGAGGTHVSVSQGFAFGNGNAADDLHIHIRPGASLELIFGSLDYQNVN